MRSWSRHVPAALVAAASAAILVRTTVRDRFPLLDLLYYVTPWPIITGLLLASAVWVTLMRRPLRGLVLLTLALITALPLGSARSESESESESESKSESATSTSTSPHRCPASRETLDVVFWNVARGRLGWNDVASELERSRADIIGLVEAGRRRGFDLESRLPGYSLVEAGRGVALLTRGDARLSGVTRFGRLSTTAIFDVTVEDRSFRVALVDIEAYPLSRREPLMRRVLELVEADAHRNPAHPAIVMGDFNTPHDSVWLEPLGRMFPPAFDGYHPTWPRPVPILMLDHLFRSEALGVRCAAVVSTSLSDHGRLHVSLTLP